MHIVGIDEQKAWDIIVNFKYFDKNLNVVKEPQGFMEVAIGTYSNEAGLVYLINALREILHRFDGDEAAARKYCNPTVLELIEDLLVSLRDRKPSKYPIIGDQTFDFWLNIHKRLIAGSWE